MKKNNKRKKIDLSLIIPCYNEENILKDSIKMIIETLDLTTFAYEIIFVDDESKDRTKDIINKLINKYPDRNLKKIFHQKNTGRGGCVRDGIIGSSGEIVGFIDIDLSTPVYYIPILVLEIKKGIDVVSADRQYHINFEGIPRWILTRGYNWLMRKLLKVDLKDTETGCKFFKRKKIIPILDKVQDTHWFWDTEIMFQSLLNGLKIKEIPTLFVRKGFYTKVKIIRDSIYYLKNLLKLRRELRDKIN